MKLRKILLIISLGIVCNFSLFSRVSRAYAQVEDLDSMITALDFMPDDSAKVNQLIGIAKSLNFKNPGLGLSYIEQALALADKTGYENGDIFKTRGNLRYTQGDYKDALDDYRKSLDIFTTKGDSLNIANVYNNLGILYEDKNNFDEAKKYYARALRVFLRLNNFNGQATIYLNLGWLDDNIGQYDSSIYNYNKSLRINSEVKSETLDAILQANLGRAYMHKGSYDTARYYFDEGMKRFETVEDNEGITEIYRNLGELSIINDEYDKALAYLDQAQALAIEHNFKEYLVESYQLKSQVYEALGDYKKSLLYHQQFKELSDSIFTIEKDQALYAFQIMQQHERQMADLNQQNQLQTEKLKSARFKNFLLLSISLFTLFVLLILTYYFMHKQKTSIQLRSQNQEIKKQKKEIEKQKRKLARINRDLQDKNMILNQLNKEKDYLLHVVAHDLKSPLNQMSGLAQVVKIDSENLTETQKNCLDKIETVSSRLSVMVDKILDIDAIEKKSTNLSLEEIDLREILDETTDDFEHAARNKKIKIHTNLNGQVSPVKVDRQHALQIFENLLSNAIKFSPPNKEIFINLVEDSENIVAEVKDQGPGFTEEDKKEVFKKFKKLSARPTGNEDSNGLGLSIVKKYVEAMNGKVWLESEHGAGASFKVAFKKVSMDPAARARP